MLAGKFNLNYLLIVDDFFKFIIRELFLVLLIHHVKNEVLNQLHFITIQVLKTQISFRYQPFVLKIKLVENDSHLNVLVLCLAVIVISNRLKGITLKKIELFRHFKGFK